MNKHDLEVMFQTAKYLLFHLSWPCAKKGGDTFDTNIGAYQGTQIGELVQVIVAQETKFYIKVFFSKCDQIRSFLQIWLRLP